MSYRFERDETISDAVRRVAHELLGESLGLLDAPGDDVEGAVHEVRKNCKKLRGLVRLVRPAMGDAYRTANVTARDAARELASIRDAHALLETCDHLVAARPDDVVDGGLVPVRRELAGRAGAATEAVSDRDQRILDAAELLTNLRDQVDDWPLTEDVGVLAAGAAKTYKRGRKRWRDSQLSPTDERLHQWRKRVKYTWYHLRLLRDSAPGVLRPLIGQFHDLSDALGDDHDLVVLTEQLQATPLAFGGLDAVERAMQVITPARTELQSAAASLGARLYVEPPDRFADRLAGYWTVWHEHGDEQPAGEISDLTPPSDDLDERSVRDLYAIARELELDGRSSMDRDALIGTIRASGWTEG
jgi:CHAD domain-containing protein